MPDYQDAGTSVPQCLAADNNQGRMQWMPGFVLASPRCLETYRPVNRPRDTSAKPGEICYTLQLRTAVPACGAFGKHF